MIRSNNYSKVEISDTIKYCNDNANLIVGDSKNRSAFLQACRMAITNYDKVNLSSYFDDFVCVSDITDSYGWRNMDRKESEKISDFFYENNIPMTVFTIDGKGFIEGDLSLCFVS